MSVEQERDVAVLRVAVLEEFIRQFRAIIASEKIVEDLTLRGASARSAEIIKITLRATVRLLDDTLSDVNKAMPQFEDQVVAAAAHPSPDTTPVPAR